MFVFVSTSINKNFSVRSTSYSLGENGTRWTSTSYAPTGDDVSYVPSVRSVFGMLVEVVARLSHRIAVTTYEPA